MQIPTHTPHREGGLPPACLPIVFPYYPLIDTPTLFGGDSEEVLFVGCSPPSIKQPLMGLIKERQSRGPLQNHGVWLSTSTPG